jgi:hypothetical protein
MSRRPGGIDPGVRRSLFAVLKISSTGNRCPHCEVFFTKRGDGSGMPGFLVMAMLINFERIDRGICEKLGTALKVPGLPGPTCSQSSP